MIQTMWRQPLRGPVDEGGISRISALQKLGCEILRFSVPDQASAERLGRLAQLVAMPLVADIHFDYRLALRCLDYPIAKIRINPGNIGERWKVEEVVRKAKDRGVSLRVGVNSGSLPRELRRGKNLARALLRAAENELEIFEKLAFREVIFSLKATEVDSTVEANLLFAEKYDYPLHLGVTEAGPLVPGIVKNSLAISRLLLEGVGDTIRVSLSDTPENEILAARAILQYCGIRSCGVRIISCPTCGRSEFDVKSFLEHVSNYILSLDKDISIAVMGCPVNGPGEAKRADLGITGSGKFILFFRNGKIIRRVNSESAHTAFKEEIERL